MSRAILIMGESGSGKTTSLRNLDPKETYFIDCDGKGLSWRGWREQFNSTNKNYRRENHPDKVYELMKGISDKCPQIKYIIVDTLNAIMVADEVRRSKEKGFDKWVDLANCLFEIVTNASDLREDLTVICTAHTQTEIDDTTGERFTRMLTNGKKLNKIGIEKYFTTVFLAKRDADGNFIFETQANNSTAKTPLGAFETETIPNDIAEAMKILKDY